MLTFISNELQTRIMQSKLGLPLTFITFAYVKGKMFTHFRKHSTFVLPTSNRTWGNNVVYGSVWHMSDWTFYSRLLDAYHGSSLSAIHVNHRLDLHHRITCSAVPLHFTSLSDFSRLKYREADEGLQVQMYVGNPKHPKIIQRINRPQHSYRLIDGVDVSHFTQAFREVGNG